MVRNVALVILLLLALVAAVPTAAQDDPSNLPLLDDGQHIGIQYGESTADAAQALQDRYGETLAAGGRGYALPIGWSDVEPQVGQLDWSFAEAFLPLMPILGVQPFVLIRTIDTVALTMPADYLSADGNTFAEGYDFDHPEVRARYFAVLDVLIPLIVENGGFAVSVGNEIDIYLRLYPQYTEGFIRFLAAARDHIHRIEPRMAVGATITMNAFFNDWPYVEDILANSDVAIFTYYPLNDDFTVRDPAVVFDDMALASAAAGDLPIVMQEVGYPSGYMDGAGNNSSQAQQAQFVENMFAVFAENPQIRFASFLHLGEWADASCDHHVAYYGLDAPRFREYLCTLGFLTHTAEPKLAYEALITGLENAR